MDIINFLSADRIEYQKEASSSKRVFETLADLLHRGINQSPLSHADIFDALITRERLGSTVVGNGIAVPHACADIDTPVSALLILEEGLVIDAPDKKPIWFFLAMLVPSQCSQQHSENLSHSALTLSQSIDHENFIAIQDAQLTLDHLTSIFTQDLAA